MWLTQLAGRWIGVVLFLSPMAFASTTGCEQGSALIGVSDGFFTILCGCLENAGTVIIPPTHLTCTVPRETAVFFQWIGTYASHQIVSTGEPSFNPSPINPPGHPELSQTYVVRFPEPGNYEFKDLIQGQLIGQIIVQ